MQNIVFRLFFLLTLIVYPANSFGLRSLQKSQAVIQSTQVFTEDFSSFAYKRYVSNATWSTANGELSLEKLDSTDQNDADIAPTINNQFILVWRDDRESTYQYYAQKIDANGNRLWPTDQRVNIGTPGRTNTAPRCTADSQGNVYVTWADDRSGMLNIYVQKIDPDGNQLWASDMQANKLTDRNLYKPAIAVDSANRPVIAWRSQEVGSNVYAQRLSLAGVPQWISDVQVNQAATNTPFSSYDDYIDAPVIKTNITGGIAISWFSHDNLVPTSVSLRLQFLSIDGSLTWPTDTVIGATEVGTYEVPKQAIDLDATNNIYAAWWIGTEIALQKLGSSGSLLWTNPRIITGLNIYHRGMLSLEGTTDAKLLIAWDQILVITDLNGVPLYPEPFQMEKEGFNARYSDTRITLSTDGSLFAAWSRESIWPSGSQDVFVRKVVLGSPPVFPWPVEASVSDHNGHITADVPRLSTTNGGFYFAWTDLRNNDWSVFLNRLDTNGNLVWPSGILISSPGSSMGGGGNFDLSSTSNGDAVVVAVTNGPLLVQQVDSQGNKLNSTTIDTNGIDPRVAVDRQDNIIIAWNDWGAFKVMKFTQNLQVLWGPVTVGTLQSNSGSTISNGLDITSDSSNNTIIVWQDTRNRTYPSSDLYTQKLNAEGIPQWGNGLDIDPGFTWYSASPIVQVDSTDHIYVGWRDPWNWIYLHRLAPNGMFDWTNPSALGEGDQLAVATNGENSYINYTWKNNGPLLRAYQSNQFLIWADPISLSNSSSSSSPAVISLNSDIYSAWRQNDRQIYLQKNNWAGSSQWANPVNIAIPFDLYRDTGVAESLSVDTVSELITQATVTADYQLNGGGLEFYLSNNGGIDWALVTPGVAQVFTTTGSDLRWKIELTADPIWPRTPVVNGLHLEYSSQSTDTDDYEPDDTCSQARPIALNGAVQQHNFHQATDADWIWLDIIQGKTYIIQTSQAETNADTRFAYYRDCAQVPLGTNENAYGRDTRLTFSATYTGRLYIKVSNQIAPPNSESTGYLLSARLASSPPVVVIVAGHDDSFSLQANIDYSADLAYQTFINSGVPKANIRYFSPNINRDVDSNGLNDDIAGLPDPAGVRDAIQDWSPSRGVSLGVPFFLYLVDHGNYDQFLSNGTGGKITAGDLDLWLSNLEATSGADQINVIIEACHSGSFINQDNPGPNEISSHNRVVISSTSSNLNAYSSLQGSIFSDVLWTALGSSTDLKTAFEQAKQAVQATGLSQEPWLDDNGDGVANNLDGTLARNRGLNSAYADSSPVIDWANVTFDQTGLGSLQAQVRDDFGIEQVWVQVFEPDFVEPAPTEDGSIPLLNTPIVQLNNRGSQSYQQVFTFNKIGTYRLVFYAKDTDGNFSIPYNLFILYGHSIFLPDVQK